MSRNKFRELLSNLHLAGNTQIDTGDRYYKSQVLFEKLDLSFKQYVSFLNHSVDESIIPYYGKHNKKRFIRGSLIRFGFSLWSITLFEGFLFHADPYCGVDTSLGHGANAMLGLIEKREVKTESIITLENLSTSLLLSDELTKLGICALGTL